MKGIANGFCLLVICSTLLIACSSPAPSLPRSYLLSPSAPQEAKEISRPVWLVADNQIHNLYGEPIPLLRTGLADRLVEWAIRSVQLDFYGEYLLRWFLERRASAEPVHPVIHLGDASDISCTGEFERFLEIMRLAKGGWVMAPGNHDGFFYGDEQADLEGDSDWTDGCKNAGEPMTKDRFIRLYLQALNDQYGQEGRPLWTGPSIPSRGDWRVDSEKSAGRANSFLSAVTWNIDEGHPWRSFLVQELDLSAADEPVKVKAVILDTVQYRWKPCLLPLFLNAGWTGGLRDDQVDVVRSWIGQPGVSNPAKPCLWILFGHHRFEELGSSSQKAVDDLRKRSAALLYVSAHDHQGKFVVNGKDYEEGNWLELNLGSALDWPAEARRFGLIRAKMEGAKGLAMLPKPGRAYPEALGRLRIRPSDSAREEEWAVLLDTPRYVMEDLLREEGIPAHEPRWEATPNDPDYYLRHEDLRDLDAVRAEIILKSTLLASHRRLLENNPTVIGAAGDFWPEGCSSDALVLERIEILLGESRRQLETSGKPQEEKAILQALTAQRHDLTGFLVEFDRFERLRPVQDPETRRKYRLSQAVWASWYDSVHSRNAPVNARYIVFPPPNPP
jgi:hypothetical protein